MIRREIKGCTELMEFLVEYEEKTSTITFNNISFKKLFHPIVSPVQAYLELRLRELHIMYNRFFFDWGEPTTWDYLQLVPICKRHFLTLPELWIRQTTYAGQSAMLLQFCL
jgi:hypothetical protein